MAETPKQQNLAFGRPGLHVYFQYSPRAHPLWEPCKLETGQIGVTEACAAVSQCAKVP